MGNSTEELACLLVRRYIGLAAPDATAGYSSPASVRTYVLLLLLSHTYMQREAFFLLLLALGGEVWNVSLSTFFSLSASKSLVPVIHLYETTRYGLIILR